MAENHYGPEVQTRNNYLLSRLCLADRPTVTKKILVQEVNAYCGQNVSEAAIIDSLRKIRESGIPGFTITISDETVTFKRRDTIILRERQKRNLEIKRDLGIVLWEVLLRLKIDKEVLHEPCAPLAKLEALSDRTHLAFLVDAGSSTSFAIEQLLTTRAVPIPTQDGRLIRPTFITNSLEIADVVSRSDYPRDIPVRIIGGDLRVEYGSICGPMTDLCLSGWGSMAADIAIVGATSCSGKTGISCFGCDDISEGRVKVKMLESASLRVVILDSSKLSDDVPPSRPFAKLSNHLVDLIVIDDGKTTGEEFRVAKLKQVAKAEGVGVVVMQTDNSHRYRTTSSPRPSQPSAKQA